MADFRLERLFVMLDEPVPGLDHMKAVDAVEFAWHGSDDHVERLGLTPLGAFTFAPYERPSWHAAREGLTTVRALRSLYGEWLAEGNNPIGYSDETLVTKAAVLGQVEEVLASADSLGRRFYLAARDLS